MGNEIKEYKQVLVIELKDGTILHSPKTVQELKTYLESCKEIAEIDGVLFNKYEFKKATVQKIDGVEDYILTQPKEVQVYLKAIQKEYPLYSQRLEYLIHKVELFNKGNK